MPPGRRTADSRAAALGILTKAYQFNGDRPVAYLDETYEERAGASTFYVMTAAVVQADQRDYVRDDITRIAGRRYWHTTDALQSVEGRAKASELLTYLGDPNGNEVCLISRRSPIEPEDSNGEHARADCLTRLLKHLNDPSSVTGSVDLFVLETRLTRQMGNIDARTMSEAIKSGAAAPNVKLFQTSPAVEPLLWLPDLVCSAYRQLITGRRSDLYDMVADICTVLP
jgi:hypothetical protein